MTEVDWVLSHAEKVEVYKVPWESLYDRKTFNSLSGEQQTIYIESLRKRASKELYRAWKGDTFYDISKKTYNAWMFKTIGESL